MVFRPEVFVSASTTEFGPLRKTIADALHDLGAAPVGHTDFSVAYGPLQGVLNVAIGRCAAVIHVAGSSFGPEPPERSHGAVRRSFAHFEVDIAKSLQKPIFLFLAQPGASAASRALDDPEAARLQEDHRRALVQSGEHWTFANAAELRQLLHALRSRLIIRRSLVRLPFPPRREPLPGRERVLAELKNALGQPGVVVLHPPPERAASSASAGKTALAVEAAWQLHERGRFDFVFFLPGGLRVEIEAGLAALARADALALLADENGAHPARLAAVRAWLRAEEHADRFLIVLDGVDNEVAWWAVQSVLPWFARGAVLITSRRALAWSGLRTFAVGALSPEDALAYLTPRVFPTRPPAKTERAMIERLAAALGHQPLALQLVANAPSPEQFLIEPATAQRSLPQEEAARAQRWQPVCARVIAESIVRLDPAARALLHVLVCLAPQPLPIPLTIFSRAADATDVRIAVGQFERAGLVAPDASGQSVFVHRVVREIIRDRMTAEEHTAALGSARGLIEAALPKSERGGVSIGLVEALVPHGRVLLGQLNGHPLQAGAAPLCRAFGRWLREAGRASEAEPFCRRAVHIAEENLGAAHPDIVPDLRRLAGVLRDLRRFDEATELHCRVLGILEKNGVPTELTADLYALAGCLRAQHRLAEAEAPLRRALEIEQRKFGLAHRRTAIAQHTLAGLLETVHRPIEALPLYRRALQTDEIEFGPDHPRVAVGLHDLAGTLTALGWRAEAIARRRRALAIDETIFGSAHADLAPVLKELAALFEREDQPDDAATFLRRALAIEEAAFGRTHLEVAATLAALAALLHAPPLAERALGIIARPENAHATWQPFVRTAAEACRAVLRE